VICRITKSIRLQGRIFINILLTAPVLRNRCGITKRGVLKNTGILLGTLLKIALIDLVYFSDDLPDLGIKMASSHHSVDTLRTAQNSRHSHSPM
jgi:hypothetical protein